MTEILPTAFALNAFQDFYEEVLRLKEKALRASLANPIPIAANQQETPIDVKEDDQNDSPPPESQETTEGDTENSAVLEIENSPIDNLNNTENANDLCQNIQRRLRLYLEEQALKASYQLGDGGQSHFREVQYLMTALGDEVFLTLPWSGRSQWKMNLLETQLFHTQIAGELFFKRLDALLQRGDSHSKELAMLYLFCLSLGFRGQYKDHDDGGKIKNYKKQLYHFIYHQESDLYTPGRPKITQAVYEHIATMAPSKGLPDIRSWILTLSGVMFVYLFVTYVSWYKVVRDVDEALKFILDQARFLPL